jgi:K+-sensing histidine kinase KdpD
MSPRLTQEIDGAGLGFAIAGIAACLALGAAFGPGGGSVGIENIAIAHLAIVALVATFGGRAAGLATAVFAGLNYNWFFTSPYYTLRIDTPRQVLTVLLLIAAGVVASLGGRVSRRAVSAAREESDAVEVLNRIVRAVADRADADQAAADGLAALLGARTVQVWRAGPEGDHLSAAAGEQRPAATAALPHLDPQGRIPPGHQRVVGGRMVLPATGVAVDLDRAGRRVGALVVVPVPDRPVERATRAAIATVAHVLAAAPPVGLPTGNGDRPVT